MNGSRKLRGQSMNNHCFFCFVLVFVLLQNKLSQVSIKTVFQILRYAKELKILCLQFLIKMIDKNISQDYKK